MVGWGEGRLGSTEWLSPLQSGVRARGAGQRAGVAARLRAGSPGPGAQHVRAELPGPSHPRSASASNARGAPSLPDSKLDY